MDDALDHGQRSDIRRPQGASHGVSGIHILGYVAAEGFADSYPVLRKRSPRSYETDVIVV
jgi:hypothetical protein